MQNAIRKGYVDLIDGSQIHYRSVAGTGAPIVFLHQTASSGAMWEQVMTRIGGIRPLYAFDTPGFGGSFDPDGNPSITDYSEWLREAIDILRIDRFHVVGHHTGACLGVELAVTHRPRVLSLAMIGPVPLTAEERNEFRKHFSTPMSPTVDGGYLKQTWDYLRGLGADSDLALHHRELVDTVRAYLSRSKIYSAVWDQDFIAWYRQVACPMLLMCAPADVLLPYFQRAKELRPDAASVMLDGANFEPDQDPDGTARAIQRFIDGVV